MKQSFGFYNHHNKMAAIWAKIGLNLFVRHYTELGTDCHFNSSFHQAFRVIALEVLFHVQ